MGKNVAVFVDVANIFYAAKAAGVDIDYVTLLKASSAGRDLVRAYAYTGLDPDNENQRNFHDFLRRHGYKVVSKDIRKYGDGKVKANLDIELVVDMMKTARNLDIAIVVSGDGDFAPAIRAVQEQGVRVEVVSFRGNTSSDLMDVADQFTDITQIAKVEKGSSRSGRRVADDDADLSMTEVPDKQSEGAGDRTRGGRGRTRRTATTTAGTRGRSRTSVAVREPRDEGGEGRDASGAPLLVLPGEKLSRAARPAASDEDLDVEDFDAEGPEDADGEGFAEGAGDAGELGELGEDGRRRRRRRGGRGRGRGRRDGVAGEEGLVAAASERPSGEGVPSRRAENGDGEDDVDEAPRTRRTASTFGSVWDSQIGAPAPSSARRPIIEDEEDLDEPAIPEYLLTERRQRDGGRGRGGGGRGRGGAYAAALDRERYGGGRGSTPSRFAEPAPRREGGFGRPDRDRGGRPGQDRGGDRGRQGFRDVPRPAPRGSGDEPWSEVPPEIEAMLRAQMGSRADEPRRPAPSAPRVDEPELTADSALDEGGETEPPATVAPARRSRTSRTSAAAAAPATDGDVSDAEAPAPAAKATRSRTRKAAADAGTSSEEPVTGTTRTRSARTGTSATRTTTRRTRTASAPSDDATPTEAVDAGTAGSGDAEAEATAPKRRTTRRKAEPAA